MAPSTIMTNLPHDDTRLFVLFGEMRGDLKSLLRSNEELKARLLLTESSTDARITTLSGRVASLESIKLKVAGFTTALGLGAGFAASYLPEIINALKMALGV